ncbi:MAG: hypothetical protein KDI71_23060 [Xanthomonadales bacterium]|nr:hypothetical protein [Xanthomonadales bacterium]
MSLKGIVMTGVLAMGLAACASGSYHTASKDGAMEDRRVSALRDGDREADGDKICKSTPITGSRAMKRVCHTREEWAAMRRNGEETVRTTQQRPTGHFENTGGNGG